MAMNGVDQTMQGFDRIYIYPFPLLDKCRPFTVQFPPSIPLHIPALKSVPTNLLE